MKKTLTILAIALLLFLGFGGIYGAWMLISDPSGGNFGFPLDLLNGTPFNSYLIPGIILLLFIGLLPVSIALLSIIKKKYVAWLITIQGGILIGWLTVELIFNPDFFVPEMHYPSYGTGVILVIIGLLLIKKE